LNKHRNILIHTHIFKNAGSSYDGALRNFFGEAFVDYRDDQDIVRGKMDYLLEYLDTHPDIQAFSSHSVHFLPQNGCMIEREVDGKQETVKRIMFKPTKAK